MSNNKTAGAGAATPTPATGSLNSQSRSSELIGAVPVPQGLVDGGLDPLLDRIDALLDACDSIPEPVDDGFHAVVGSHVTRLNDISKALAELVRDWRAHVLTSFPDAINVSEKAEN